MRITSLETFNNASLTSGTDYSNKLMTIILQRCDEKLSTTKQQPTFLKTSFNARAKLK